MKKYIKYILLAVTPLLLSSFRLKHSGPYIPDDQLQKEVLTLGPDYIIDLNKYGQTIISDIPYIKFVVDSVSRPPVSGEFFLLNYYLSYTCINGEHNGINYYLRVLPLNESYIEGPTPENCPESTWEIDALFTKDPHFFSWSKSRGPDS